MRAMQSRGWHSRGYLPHFDSPETIQFVTFRLADSLPASVTESIRLHDHILQRLDRELDVGLGACWLKRPDIASLVEKALLHFDGERYRLLAWCLMPNHVHVVTEMIDGYSLSGSWEAGSLSPPNRPIHRSAVPALSGTPIISIGTCEMRPISSGRSSISKAIPSKRG